MKSCRCEGKALAFGLWWLDLKNFYAMIAANNPSLRSWVEVPEGSDFPIQNLPFGIFKAKNRPPAAGVAIGRQVVNLDFLHKQGYLDNLSLPTGIFSRTVLNDLLALGRKKCCQLRNRISELLQDGNTEINAEHRGMALVPMKEVEMLMPIYARSYTDFYSSEEHATNVGSMFRDPAKALLPNWKHLPVGYHGRASSIVVSGNSVIRPKGQIKPVDSEIPVFYPTDKLDFELEIAFITCVDTQLGTLITTDKAEEFIFGVVLLNDWSARDIQSWEYVPLGPFLSKNFCTTISPWIVTLDALEPFRTKGPEQFPHVLPYLAFEGERNFDIHLEVLLQPEKLEPVTVCRTNFKYMYWNMAQQLAHHTVNGCNIQVGDIYASGTISGPSPGSYGSLLELTWNGQRSLHFPEGVERKFLEDGDTVIMKAHAEQEGIRIGFGECKGKIVPSLVK